MLAYYSIIIALKKRIREYLGRTQKTNRFSIYENVKSPLPCTSAIKSFHATFFFVVNYCATLSVRLHKDPLRQKCYNISTSVKGQLSYIQTLLPILLRLFGLIKHGIVLHNKHLVRNLNKPCTFCNTILNSSNSLYVCRSLSLLEFISINSCSCSASCI